MSPSFPRVDFSNRSALMMPRVCRVFGGGQMKKPILGDKAVMKRYGDLLADIKTCIRQAQNRAVMSANAKMIRMYWDIGQMVAKRQELEGWTKFEACRVAPTRHIPFGIKYSLSLHDRNNTRILGFDNAHAQKPKRKKYGARKVDNLVKSQNSQISMS